MPTLVMAPTRVAKFTWPEECEKWGQRGMDVVPIVGDSAQWAMALRRDAPIFTINYENLPWLIDWFKHNPRPWPFRRRRGRRVNEAQVDADLQPDKQERKGVAGRRGR